MTIVADEVIVAQAPAAGSVSAVSWGAIIAGAFVAAAVSLVMLSLGLGFGLLAVGPYGSNASAGTVTAVTGIWMVVSQWIGAGLGGYLTGRLRTRWHGVHTHEVFFRDTAHGFMMWAVAAVAGVFLLGAAVSMAHGPDGEGLGSDVAAYSAAAQAQPGAPADPAALAAATRSEQAQTAQAEEAARKAAGDFALFTALSMIVGAFIACVAAALGGQQRDLHP